MPNTQNFEVVAELTRSVLQQILEAAWDNSIIPHSFDIAAGTMFGPYQAADGIVNIPKTGLLLEMVPADNAVAITLTAQIQVEIANPPIPSASMFDMTANIVVTTPIGKIENPPDPIKVGVLLSGLPRNKVAASLTSGDPIGTITLTMISEYVHARYVDGTIPATITQEGVSLGVYTADAFVEIFDDSSNASRQITVSQPAANQVKVLIPIHLRLSNITAPAGPQPLSPMGVVAKISITAQLEVIPGSITAKIVSSTNQLLATIDVEDFAPAPASDYPNNEGSNYSLNKTGASIYGIDLEQTLKDEIKNRGRSIAKSMGNISVAVPTVSQIETFIGDKSHAELISRGNISLWTPQPPAGGGVTITDVAPKALADALAICINPGPGANANAITNFIPAGRTCAIAINGAKVLQIIDETIHRPESDGGFGPDFPPKTFHNINGHDAELKSLTISLRTGAIHMEGDVTVIDAIAGSIDVDASFEANAGLQWEDNPDGSGTQMIKPYVIDQDVDLSLLAWILSFLLGFITLGLVGGIIALVVMIIVEGIAERVGGAIIRDDVTNQIKGIGAWPQTLEGIGTVTARFENPVSIDSDGIMFPDAYLVTAKYALTVNALARANGPYVVTAGSLLNLTGGPIVTYTQYKWALGDGSSATGAIVSHTYADNGIYVAKLTTKVSQSGGVTTRHFARIKVLNVPPTVNAGPNMEIDEGQEVEFTATFSDQEWKDTHKAIFDFGDNSLPVEAVISETNDPPKAQGTALAKHAYCDNGEYTVTVRVRDDDGGIGMDTLRVEVRNVPPTVNAGEDLYAYPCMPITLMACFTDPGWCDTHTGSWDFGDCNPPFPALILEKHDPPAGTGTASAMHIYEHCGTYLAECTVTDDDSASGSDAIAVRVIDVLNKDFEDGFRNRTVGAVANHWEPYPLKSEGARGALFKAEEFVVHGGQRSQSISASGQFRTGMYQKIGANPGWDYQISAWYHLDERTGGTCQLGIDPRGGSDPSSPDIIWSKGNEHRNWTQLAARINARANAITIFLEAAADAQGASAYFDDVMLVATPCPLKEKVSEPPPVDLEKCVDWKGEKDRQDVGVSYEKNGFTFSSLTKQPLRIVKWGLPAGEPKMVIQPRGVQVQLPFAAHRIVAQVVPYHSEPIKIEAFDATGKYLGQATAATSKGVIQTVELKAPDITSLLLSGGGNEGLLISLCVYGKGSTTGANKERAYSWKKNSIKFT